MASHLTELTDFHSFHYRTKILVPIPITKLATNWTGAVKKLIFEHNPWYPRKSECNDLVELAKGYFSCLLINRIFSVLIKSTTEVYRALPDKVKNLDDEIFSDHIQMDVMTHALLQGIGLFDDPNHAQWIEFIPSISYEDKTEGMTETHFLDGLCSPSADSVIAFRTLMLLLQSISVPNSVLDRNDIRGTPWFLLCYHGADTFQKVIGGRFNPSAVSNVDLSLFHLFGGYLQYMDYDRDLFNTTDKPPKLESGTEQLWPMVPAFVYTCNMTDVFALTTLGVVGFNKDPSSIDIVKAHLNRRRYSIQPYGDGELSPLG